MLGYRLRHAIQYPLKVVQFAGLLNLHDDDLILAVLGLDVNTVELVVRVFLVAFAFQNFNDMDWLAEEHRYQSLKHTEIGLVAQHPLCSPVESYESLFVHIFIFHSFSWLRQNNPITA